MEKHFQVIAFTNIFNLNIFISLFIISELLTVCWNNGKPYQPIYGVQAKSEILNPTLEPVYAVLRELLDELRLLFPDDYVHLGNDEVYYECWYVKFKY